MPGGDRARRLGGLRGRYRAAAARRLLPCEIGAVGSRSSVPRFLPRRRRRRAGGCAPHRARPAARGPGDRPGRRVGAGLAPRDRGTSARVDRGGARSPPRGAGADAGRSRPTARLLGGPGRYQARRGRRGGWHAAARDRTTCRLTCRHRR
ncbi:hypothetical protein T492DRAFT_1020754 [Pavlovales sp. CCMP2436]|nr:hypothetical protein T492DRAFT_1020754 [Pavlovales sp. CCMP2436]